MKLPHRRNVLRLAAGAVALPAVPRIAAAQTYPSRPGRLIVGFPAGGGADITARLMGQWVSELFRFITTNIPKSTAIVAPIGAKFWMANPRTMTV